MGFRLETRFRLFFEDEAFIGAEVTMGRMSIREAFEFDRVRFREVADLDELEKKSEDLAAIVAKHLIDWNLEDAKGKPIPCTAKAIIDSQDDLLPTLVNAYVQAVAGVVAPLGQSSNGGQPSDLAASIPMEPLSESQSS
jgi:hypothetical protein